jgi:hypothetical protein
MTFLKSAAWLYFGPYGPGKIIAARKERKKRGAYGSGERAKQALDKCFPDGIPSRADVPDSVLVRRAQAKHGELYKGEPTPGRKTILTHAGR